nr:hypothetical protein NEAPIHCB_00045 [Escherichia coli]
MSLIDAQYFWFGHEKVTYSMLEQTNFAFSVRVGSLAAAACHGLELPL